MAVGKTIFLDILIRHGWTVLRDPTSHVGRTDNGFGIWVRLTPDDIGYLKICQWNAASAEVLASEIGRIGKHAVPNVIAGKITGFGSHYFVLSPVKGYKPRTVGNFYSPSVSTKKIIETAVSHSLPFDILAGDNDIHDGNMVVSQYQKKQGDNLFAYRIDYGRADIYSLDVRRILNSWLNCFEQSFSENVRFTLDKSAISQSVKHVQKISDKELQECLRTLATLNPSDMRRKKRILFDALRYRRDAANKILGSRRLNQLCK